MISDLIVFQKTYDFLLWVKPTVQRFANNEGMITMFEDGFIKAAGNPD